MKGVGETADLGMLGCKQARVKIERGKSTSSAILGALQVPHDKDTQIAARGHLSDTAGSGHTDCQIGVAVGTTALGSP